MLTERLTLLLRKEVTVITKSYHLGYSSHKGELVLVAEEYIELDTGKKTVIIPMSEINAFTIKE